MKRAQMNEKTVYFQGKHSIAGREFPMLGRVSLLVADGRKPVDVLMAGVTDWVNTSDDGQKLWREKGGKLSFVTLHDAGVFGRTDFAACMKKQGSAVTDFELVDPELILPADTQLVDQKNLIKFDLQAGNNVENDHYDRGPSGGFTFG